MLTAQLVNTVTPQLQPNDKLAKAKQLMVDYKLTHLPVVNKNKFLGLIAEDDVLDESNEQATIESILDLLLIAFLPEDVHFLNALNYCNQYDANLIPIIDKEANYMGCISSQHLLKTIGEFTGSNEIGGLIILAIKPIQFSISEISRIVESNNATDFHLNSTFDVNTGLMMVTIHLNKKEIDSIMKDIKSLYKKNQTSYKN
jgi:predicted transcriptional regulator